MKARKIRKPRNAHKKTRARKTYKNMETRKAHKALRHTATQARAVREHVRQEAIVNEKNMHRLQFSS